MISYSATFFLVCLATTSLNAEKNIFSCFNQTSDPKIRLDEFPEKFKVSINFVDIIKAFSAEFVEYEEKGKNRNVSVLKRQNGTQMFDYILDRTANTLTFVNKTDNNVTCDVVPYTSAKSFQDAFFLPYELMKLDQSVLGLSDLVTLLNSANFSKDDHDHGSDHGIAVDHLSACRKTADGKYWLEFKICLPQSGFAISGLNSVKERLPTRIELAVYDEKASKDLKARFNGVYEMSNYRTTFEDSDLNYHLPPPGTYCYGRNKTKSTPTFPQAFSVSLEAVEYNKKRIYATRVEYNENEKLVLVDFTRTNNFAPLFFGTVDKSEAGHYLIQDFRSGMQYNLEPTSLKCVSAQAIPTGSCTAKAGGPDKRHLAIKESFELLFRLPASAYTFVGTHYDNSIPFEVWNAIESKFISKDLTEDYVHEIWFSMEKWTFDQQTFEVIPIYFKTYMRDNHGQQNFVTVRFYNYITYNDESVNNSLGYDVFDCLNLHGYFMLQLNDTMEHIKTVGNWLVINRLREEVAKVAGINLFRIGKFTIIPNEPKSSVNVSFAVAKKFDQPGAKTEYNVDEVDPTIAMTKFNQTLLSGNFSFSVNALNDKKLYLSTVKDSYLMAGEPAFFSGRLPPTVVKRGYSGGSMTTMAFFMLLIGAGGGVFLAVMYMKRTRGGVAYQIYE